MALVQYSSESESESEATSQHEPPPPSKKRKAPDSAQVTAASPAKQVATKSPLPPLPPSFHDLYASTVRTATSDLPSLHQGRRRQIPHVAGNWPSHIYVEWHPDASQHALLTALLARLAADLDPPLPRRMLSSFLTSDLGAPLPLHVSLSRPFVLRTDDKDRFPQELAAAVRRSPRAALCADALAWHRSPDSERSFLVLRVRRRSSSARGRNPELAALLRVCNDLVAARGQPRLYAARHGAGGHDGGGDGGEGEGEGASVPNSETEEGDVDESAFHVSIAWSFAEPTTEIRERTAEVFAREEFRRGIVDGITIPLDGIKVKIGNVVTNIALATNERKKSGLFGV